MKLSNRVRRLCFWFFASVAVLAAGLVAAFFLLRWAAHRPLRYDQAGFHETIAGADRIVIRNDDFGGNCDPRDASNTVFAVTDQAEVRSVASHLQFNPITTTNSWAEACLCGGWPRIDWYRGNKRIALTSLQHERAIRWKGFSNCRILGIHIGYGDGPLTDESAQWLVDWFAKHGESGLKYSYEKDKRGRKELEQFQKEREATKKSGGTSPAGFRSQDDPAIAKHIKALEDRNSDVREAAAKALREIMAKRASDTPSKHPSPLRIVMGVEAQPKLDYTGTWIEWFTNGQKWRETNYKDGLRDGPSINYYDNGQKSREAHYTNGACVSYEAGWYRNGRKKYERHEQDGKRHGLCTEWHPNGQKQREGTYKDGKLDGTETWWFENGQIQYQVHKKNGVLDGTVACWNEQGVQLYRHEYGNGRLVK